MQNHRRTRPGPAVALSVALAAASTGALAAGPAAGDAQRGKQVYAAGTGAAAITAQVGTRGTKVPATAVPCVNCHGTDGRGRAERGVVPPNITWDQLTKSYGRLRDNGRRYPPYTFNTLRKALAEGIDSAGEELAVEMPRYTFSDQDYADLVAYLGILGHEAVPGVSSDTIRVATVLPLEGPAGGAGRAMLSVMEGVVAQTNEAGGIYGRKLALDAIRVAPGEAPAAALARASASPDAFAVVSPFATGDEAAMRGVADRTEIPIIAPFAPLNDSRARPDPETFYLSAGLREQAAALLKYTAGLPEARSARVAIVADSQTDAGVLGGLITQAGKLPLDGVETFAIDNPDGLAGLSAALTGGGVGIVVMLVPLDPVIGLFGAADRSSQHPFVLIPAGLSSSLMMKLPRGFDGRIFVGYPSLPKDGSRMAAEALRAIQQPAGLDQKFSTAQFHAFDAMRLLIEGIKRSGRDLTRTGLVVALEELREFSPGLSAPVSYGPNRRVGANGAHIVAVDLASQRFKPTGDYIYLE